MATYKEKDFDSKNYDVNRPRYPPSLFQALFEYHHGPAHRALDVGCGPGTASFPMLDHVDTVLATDPSSVMIQPGIDAISEEMKVRIEFRVSSAEDLHAVVPEDGSIDVLISAEALHWVKHAQFFEEAARVVRHGGTVAYWGYIEPRFVGFPKANEIYQKYVYDDPEFMGPCWVQPGKDVLRYFFKDVHVPEEHFVDVEKWDYIPGETGEHTAYFLGDEKYSLRKFRQYLSSWSAVHTWRQRNVDKRDILDQFIEELKSAYGWDDDTEVAAEWGTSYVFARRR